MAKFKIEWFELKPTITGKQKADVSLEGVDGKVTIWGDYPNFVTLAPGSEVEGDLVPAKDPKFAPTLYPPKPVSTAFANKPAWANSGKKAEQIEKAQSRTEEMVKTAQERTQESVKLSGSIRDAVLITTSKMRYTEMTDQEIEAELVKWEKFVYNLHSQPFV